MSQHTYHHFERLDIAREALDLGARRSVVQQITGISQSELRRVFGECPTLKTNLGGCPSSVERLLHNRWTHLHACDFYNGFHHLLQRGAAPDQALVVAYRLYCWRHGGRVRIGFDRAFSLVKAVSRLWSDSAPTLQTLRCTACGALFVAMLGIRAADESPCVYCRIDAQARRAPGLRRATQPGIPPSPEDAGADDVRASNAEHSTSRAH